MGSQMSQLFPPTAKFTEKELPDQTDKVRDPSFILMAITIIVFPVADLLH